MGLGELNLHPWELYEYSMQEFALKLEATRKIFNLQYQNGWEQTREVMFIIAQTTPGVRRGLTKYSIMKFPWDKQRSQSIVDLPPEERKEYVKRLAANADDVWKNLLNKN